MNAPAAMIVGHMNGTAIMAGRKGKGARCIRYGKGIDPEARLNLGDCASYALAKGLNLPLLFKGCDFSATDVLQSA